MNRGGRVLVLEDAAAVRELVGFHLRRAGFQVIEADSATSAWPSVGNADLVVLDWMLPDEPGLVFLRRLRDRNGGAEVPVLMLTARATEMDRIEGLESGADDYLVKPFSVAELVARVRALLRRIQPADRVQIGPLLVDSRQGRVSLGGIPKELTRREFELIRFLAAHPGRVFSRSELLDRVWGEDFIGTERTIDQHVAQLRSQLGSGLIETVRGRGYRLVDGEPL
ncbi:MAG: winged helix-turn-helix domain-containing protein [Truepera sp.]|nr:winged helix-turn-helix domain-containing protein [Truepera sp.]